MPPRLLRHAASDSAALKRNAAHSFAAQHALACYQGQSVYTYIPKNACTTMRLSLGIANGCLKGPEDLIWVHANNLTFQADLRDLATARFTFVILRCPHARLASAFLNKIVHRKRDYWTLDRLEGDTLEPARFTFRDFVRILQKPRRLKANPHWRPQVDFLIFEAYDAYYTVETLREDAAQIEARAGIPVVDARAITRHGRHGLAPIDDQPYADTPLIEIEAMIRGGKIPTAASLYDPGLVADVSTLYAEDIELYDRQGDRANRTFVTDDRKGRHT